MQLQEVAAYKRLPLDVVGAAGCELILSNGRRVLDLYGGHCVNVLGAGHSALGAELAAQWNSLSFATNLLDHPSRQRFLQALGRNLPVVDDGWRVFVSNSGSEANENALKCALSGTRRTKVIVFDGGFHGRTAAATFASDMTSATSRGFPAAPFDVVRVTWNDLAAVEAELDETVAAVLIEPIQSMAGVRTPDATYLQKLADLTEQAGARLIFDEVQSGSGRLGVPWAADHFGVTPHIITTAKGAGGGFPIGLTLIRGSALDGVPSGLMGSTFGGGPMALTAAAFVAEQVADDEFLANVRAASEGLGAIASMSPFCGVVGVGLLLGFRVKPSTSAKAVRDELLQHDVLVGTCNDPQILRLSPALTLTQNDVQRFATAVRKLGGIGS